jgi:hypothetical protein
VVAERSLLGSFHTLIPHPGRRALGAPCPPIGYRVFFSPWMGNKGLTGSILKDRFVPPTKARCGQNLNHDRPARPIHAFLPSVTFIQPQSCRRSGTIILCLNIASSAPIPAAAPCACHLRPARRAQIAKISDISGCCEKYPRPRGSVVAGIGAQAIATNSIPGITQLDCRRRNAGMSSWSSCTELYTGVCLPF